MVITTTLPASVTLLAATPSQGSCSGASCNLGGIPAGGSASIVIVARVNANVTVPLVNSVTLTSSTPLTNTTDDSHTIATPVHPSADLSLDVSSTPTVGAGQTGVVTFSVANSGPSLAQNVVFTATFPAGVTPPVGWSQIGSTNLYASSSAMSPPDRPSSLLGL